MTTPTDGNGGATVSWGELVAETTVRLRGVADDTALDARRIVERASGADGAEYHLGLDRPATVGGVAHLDAMVARRLAGEPLQYVVGRWGFRHLDLLVDSRVLIPRPETEVVVDHALAELDRIAGSGTGSEPACVVDLGTGSGAIALSIASERTRTQVWAVDSSSDALAVARANLAGLGRSATRVRVVEGSWFEPLPADRRGAFDLVVANPPYVAATDELPPVVADWEPRRALVSGPTGLEAVEEIVAGARTWLRSDGALVVEIGATQARAATALAARAGFTDIGVHPDLAGRPRVLTARF